MKRDRQQARDYGFLEPCGEWSGEQGVGRCKRGRVGLQAAVGEVAPLGEGD